MTRYVKTSLLLLAVIAGLLLVSSCFPASQGSTQTPQSGGFDWTYIVFIAVLIVIFYFLLIRPQRNRQNQQKKLINELKPGDRIITLSGIYGEVDSIDEVSVVLKVESGAKIRVAKQTVAGMR